MRNFPVLLHVGYHKTGTSLLQSSFFSAENSGFALPAEDRHVLVERFVVPGPFSYNTDEMRALYAGFIDDSNREGKLPVLSHERFSGYAPTGGFDSTLVADRLAATFPDAAVLIVVREQRSHIKSMYSQYLTDGGELFFNDYVKAVDPQLKRVPRFDVDFYKYDRLIDHYFNLFGRERVLVLPYEMLRSDKTEFIARMCRFVDVAPTDVPSKSVNVARPPLMQVFQLYVNRWLSDNQLSRRPFVRVNRVSKGFARVQPVFDRLVPAGVNNWIDNRLAKKIAKKFEGEFSASNQRLSEIIGIDLAQFGYQTEGKAISTANETAVHSRDVGEFRERSCG